MAYAAAVHISIEANAPKFRARPYGGWALIHNFQPTNCGISEDMEPGSTRAITQVAGNQAWNQEDVVVIRSYGQARYSFKN